jgi:hypothetical protein
MNSQSGSSAKTILLNIFFTVCIIGLAGFGALKINQLSDTQGVLAYTQSELTSTQADLSNTQSQLTMSQAKLSQTQSDLADTQSDLSDTQDKIKDTTQQLEDTTSQLAQAQADYDTTSVSLTAKKALNATLQDSIDNLQVNESRLNSGYYGYLLKNPTYQECKAFIAADQTDKYARVEGSFEYQDFVFNIKTNAMLQKIRCAYVSVHIAAGGGYYIIGFNTTDRGMVYFHPTTDEEVVPVVGLHYWTQCVIPTPDHYYLPANFDDTITQILVTW